MGLPKKLNGGGPPLGIFPRSQYQSNQVHLHVGDVLIAYTDGIVEALNPHQEEFGEDRLRSIVHSSLSHTAAGICKKVQENLQAFMAESPQSDDMTLLVMKVKPESADLD